MEYSEIQTNVADYLNRSNLTAKIKIFINSAQRKIERVGNFIGMEDEETDTLSEGDYQIDIPDTFKSTKSFWIEWEDRKYRVRKRTEDELFSVYSDLTIDTGRPLIFCPRESDGTIWLRPTADQDYTYYHYFYKYVVDLASDDDTNWITNKYPELLIYMALLEAEPYLKNDKRIATWANMASGLMEDLKGSEIQRDMAPDISMYAV